MKHRVINRYKIVEAYVEEPKDNLHGWRVVVVFDFVPDGYPIFSKFDMDTESECINFINSLNFVKI